ncbi:MAG: cysteine synthase family protein [Erysipelotrichaceae bacterium]|nr:cysteine synthase family protein [Erysipelotrichaceae bacterium]
MIFQNVLEAIGDTPLIKLNKMVPERSADIYVKYEGVNIGGSIKTRSAYNIIKNALDRGEIDKDTTIIEATSGNQGIALSLIGAVLGIRVIIVMPDSVSLERRKLIKAYGSELILIHDDNNIGECIENCLKKVRQLQKEDPKVFVPSQFDNRDNPAAHLEQTAREIIADLPHIDGFVSGFGTGGTITGIGKALKKANPDTEIWVLEPEKAAILSGGEIHSHLQMGIGDGLIPENLDTKIYDHIEIVTDKQAIDTAKELMRLEGIMAGISSGTNVYGALKLAEKLGKGKIVVTVLPDTGERYLSTPLFD